MSQIAMKNDGIEARAQFTIEHDEKCFGHLQVNVLDRPRAEEFRTVLLRAINTWENAPPWTRELCDLLDVALRNNVQYLEPKR